MYALFRSDADTLVVSLDVAGVSVSSGSACDTGTRKTADVLRTVCNEKESINGGIRVSLGRYSTEEDIDFLLASLAKMGSRR